MPRTLLISDLHLGGRLGHDVLQRPEPLARLLEAVRAADRLVLLGDIVELMEGRTRAALELALPVLKAIGSALGPHREVILVPGNHDGPLVRPWIRHAGPSLGVATGIGLAASPLLETVTGSLAPARVTVSYPGVWLGERIWATHGHYLDQHLLPESAFGIARGRLRSPAPDVVSVIDYELGRRPSLSRISGRVPRPIAAALDDLAELLRASTMVSVRRGLLKQRTAPVTAALLSLQMRRASLPALARVVERLGVEADWVLFGHVHRLGPLPGDDPEAWRAPRDGPRLANCGSWLYEPLLVHRASPPHPYWPGGALLLEDGTDPRAIGLLDGLPASALR